MAVVHLLSVAPTWRPPKWDHLMALRTMTQNAARDRFKMHTLAGDPSAADVILFCETHHADTSAGPLLEMIRRHPVYRAHREKSFVFCGIDRPVAFIPGVYSSIPKRWYRREFARCTCYLLMKNELLNDAAIQAPGVVPKWLGSFVGSAWTDPVRGELMKVKDERLLLADNSEAFVAAVKRNDKPAVAEFKRQYVQTTLESKFILCPRGYGAASIRLFEAMELGRVPVIISDQWVEPEGPDWSSCSIRIAERDVANTAKILHEHEPRWPAMAAAAKQVWSDWFSEETLFHRTVESCLDIAKSSRWSKWYARRLADVQMLKPANARLWWRWKKYERVLNAPELPEPSP